MPHKPTLSQVERPHNMADPCDQLHQLDRSHSTGCKPCNMDLQKDLQSWNQPKIPCRWWETSYKPILRQAVVQRRDMTKSMRPTAPSLIETIHGINALSFRLDGRHIKLEPVSRSMWLARNAYHTCICDEQTGSATWQIHAINSTSSIETEPLHISPVLWTTREGWKSGTNL